MKKWMLIVIISSWILMMVAFPGLYDSRIRKDAHRHYRSAPSEQSRKELQDAKASDRRHILAFEGAFGGVLAILWWALLRMEKNSREP